MTAEHCLIYRRVWAALTACPEVSAEQLAADTNLDRATVVRALDYLRSLGYIALAVPFTAGERQ